MSGSRRCRAAGSTSGSCSGRRGGPTVARDGARAVATIRGVVDPGRPPRIRATGGPRRRSTRWPAPGRSAAGRSGGPARAGSWSAMRPGSWTRSPARGCTARSCRPSSAPRRRGVAARRATARSPPTTARWRAGSWPRTPSRGWSRRSWRGPRCSTTPRGGSRRAIAVRATMGLVMGDLVAGRSRAGPALPRRAPGAVIDADAFVDRHRHRRAARARVRARPRRRALGAPAPPLRALAARRAAGATARSLVDFVARRPFVPVLGLGLPVAWRARTWAEPAARRLRFVHVAGATSGMDVTWRIEPAGRRLPRLDRARLPARGCPGSPRRRPVRSPGRSPAGRWPRSRRSPRPWRAPTRLATPPIRSDRPARRIAIRMTTVGGSGSPASASSRPSGPASTRSGPAFGAGRSPVARIDRFDPSPVPLAGRRPGRRLRPARLDAAEDRPPARPVQPVRAGRRAAGARGRGLTPGRRRRGRPASGSGSTSARRSAASPTPRSSTSAISRRGSGQVAPEPRAGGLRRRGPGQPRHRARRPRPDPVDRELVRVGRGRARRGARRPPRGPRSMPRSPAAARSR